MNLGTITSSLPWYKTSPFSGYNLIRVKPKLHRRRRRIHESFQSRHRSYLYERCIRLWQILWRSIIESSNFNTSSIRDKWHCWKSRSTCERRHFSSIATIRIGWKVVGWCYGMLLLSARCPKPPDRREISKWTKIWGILLGYALIACGIWKGDILIADIEELRKLGASETYPRRLNAKEAVITQKRWRSCTSCGRWFSKIIRKRLRIPRTTLRRESTEYILVNVRKSNLKCGEEVIDEARNKCRKVGIGTIINKMVGDWHQWKIARTNSKSSPSTSTITECSRVFQMNSDKSWIVNYGSLLPKRKRTSIMCVANLHSLPWKITSMVHKIRTTLKRRWIFKRASGNRCFHDAGKTWPPRKAAAATAAAAILSQYIRGQSPTTEKRRILREDRIWTKIPGWQTWRRHYLKRSSSGDTVMKVDKEEVGKYQDTTLPVLRMEVCKIPKLTAKKFTYKDWSHCFYRRSFKTSLKSGKMKMENWGIFVRSKDTQVRWLFHQDWGVKRKIPEKNTIHLHRGSSTRYYSIAEAELESGEKERKGVHTLVQKEDKHFLYNGCVQFVSTTMPAKQK